MKSEMGRLAWVVMVMVVIVTLAIWFVLNLLRIQSDASDSSLDVNLKRGAESNLTEINPLNTSERYIENVEKRNQENALAAANIGDSHVDRLVNGMLITENATHPDIEILKQQLQALQKTQNEFAKQLQRISNRGKSKSKRLIKPVDHYVGLDGVEYLSEDYRLTERGSVISAFDLILGANDTKLQGVNTAVTSTRFASKDDTRSVQTSPRTVSGMRDADSPTIIPATETPYFARLNLGLNTNIGGLASATIVGGELHGTVLTASHFSTKHNYLAINFDRFCTPNDVCGSIGAVAVDLEEGVAAVKGDFQGHYGIRFGGRVAASIIEGYGRAVSAGIGGSNVFIDGRLISQSSSRVTTKEALKASSSEAGATLGGYFRAFAQRPPTVRLDINHMIGIYVYAPGIQATRNRSHITSNQSAPIWQTANQHVGNTNLDSDVINLLQKVDSDANRKRVEKSAN